VNGQQQFAWISITWLRLVSPKKWKIVIDVLFGASTLLVG